MTYWSSNPGGKTCSLPFTGDALRMLGFPVSVSSVWCLPILCKVPGQWSTELQNMGIALEIATMNRERGAYEYQSFLQLSTNGIIRILKRSTSLTLLIGFYQRAYCNLDFHEFNISSLYN